MSSLKPEDGNGNDYRVEVLGAKLMISNAEGWMLIPTDSPLEAPETHDIFMVDIVTDWIYVLHSYLVDARDAAEAYGDHFPAIPELPPRPNLASDVMN